MTFRLDRRDFLRKAALGYASLASLPILADTVVKPVRAQAQGQIDFNFNAISQAATTGNVQHTSLMTGGGKVEGDTIEGGGAYNHYDDATQPPKALLEYGTWEATRLVGIRQIGTWGKQVAGVVDAEINLNQEFPSSARVNATLRIICNAGPARLFNPNPNPPPANLPEGYMLTIPGAEYGPFVPLFPPQGVTFFTTGKRVEDKIIENLNQTLQTTRTTYLPTAAIIPSAVAVGLGLALVRTRKRSGR